MNFQANFRSVVMNVSNLDRSIEFYRGVLASQCSRGGIHSRRSVRLGASDLR